MFDDLQFSLLSYANGFSLLEYTSTDDTLATMFAAGYFNEVADRVRTRDLLMVHASDGDAAARLTVSGGTVTLTEEVPTGFRTGWRDMIGSPVVKGTGANDPTWTTFRSGINAYSFSASAMKEVWFTFHVDHDYKVLTDLFLHCHWSTAGTNTGVVRWGFEYTFAKGHNQQNFPTTTKVYVEQAAQGTAYRHMVAEVAAIDAVPGAGIEVDGLLMLRVFRDAAHPNDTCTDAAFLLTGDIHYQADRHTTPNKAPNFYG
jgi:hypothetical protein